MNGLSSAPAGAWGNKGAESAPPCFHGLAPRGYFQSCLRHSGRPSGGCTQNPRRATSGERRAANPGHRFPNPDSWPSAVSASQIPAFGRSKWSMAVTNDSRGAVPTARGGQVRRLNGRPLRPPGSDRPRRRSLASCLSLRTLNSCSLSQSLFFYILRLLAWRLCTTAYAHPSMSKTIKFESKSVKKAMFSVKKRSKTSAIRHAHLNIWGVTPSGASAKAVLPLRKGHLGVVQGSKMACGKVIHR